MALHMLTIHELHELLIKKEVTSLDIVKSNLDRIVKTDPKLESLITVTEGQAIEQAKEIDKGILAGDPITNLTGIPVTIKDNICTEGILTTCGSKMLHNFIPPYNASVVNKLKEEKGIIIGKTNLDEFGMGLTTETSYYKHTKNPYDLERVAGGSSGGSAAAVAVGQSAYSIASDTGGSIRLPAAYCGVVGLKPTYGLVSRYGLIEYASSLDQIGPITKDVTDCAIVLNAIAGYDEKDTNSKQMQYPDYTKALINDVKGLRIGVPAEYMGKDVTSQVKGAILEAIERFTELGAECEEFSLSTAEYALPSYCVISSAEASSNLGRYDGIKYGYRTKDFNDLSELYENTRAEGFGEEVKKRIIIGTRLLTSNYIDKYYKKAQKVRSVLIDELEGLFKKYDIIITPTTNTTALQKGQIKNNNIKIIADNDSTVIANLAGIPAITIPCGYDSNGLAIGMQIMGNKFNEEMLLKAAYTFEQSTDFHKKKPIL